MSNIVLPKGLLLTSRSFPSAFAVKLKSKCMAHRAPESRVHWTFTHRGRTVGMYKLGVEINFSEFPGSSYQMHLIQFLFEQSP